MDEKNKPTVRKINWAFIFLALIASLGLTFAVMTAWADWRAPMTYLPENYWLTLTCLLGAIGGALALTFNRPAHKIFILLMVIVMGIMIQAQMYGLTVTGHKAAAPPPSASAPAHTISPADNDHPPGSKQ